MHTASIYNRHVRLKSFPITVKCIFYLNFCTIPNVSVVCATGIWADVEFLDATLLTSVRGSLADAPNAHTSESDASAEDDEDTNPSGGRRAAEDQSGRRCHSGGRLREADAASDASDIRVMAIAAATERVCGDAYGSGETDASRAPQRITCTRLCAATSDGLLQYLLRIRVLALLYALCPNILYCLDNWLNY